MYRYCIRTCNFTVQYSPDVARAPASWLWIGIGCWVSSTNRVVVKDPEPPPRITVAEHTNSPTTSSHWAYSPITIEAVVQRGALVCPRLERNPFTNLLYHSGFHTKSPSSEE
jgi:hypothetical protein